MKYENIQRATFLKRPNRFIAHVRIEDREEIVHVKNTGRCRELLLENASIILEKSRNPNRKTAYSLISVYKGDMLVNMDSQAPNTLAFEAIQEGRVEEIGQVDFLKKEVTYGGSRFDIYFEKEGRKGFIEVKGVTLEQDGVLSFPDAPTLRGTKHVNELIEAKKEGYIAGILFVVQMKGPQIFRPNDLNDPDFSDALRKAAAAGVMILCYDCVVAEDEVRLDKKISYNLEKSI